MNAKEACRLARGSRCDCRTCHYCDQLFGGRHEHDHFPIPKVAGGTAVVAACLDCHDLKDRYTLSRWPIDGYARAIKGLFEEALASVEDRVDDRDLPVRVASHPSLSDDAVLARWSDLQPLSRILYGKLRRLEEESRFHQLQDGLSVPNVSTLASAARTGTEHLARHRSH